MDDTADFYADCTFEPASNIPAKIIQKKKVIQINQIKPDFIFESNTILPYNKKKTSD
jgi:hypothetical protein